MDKSVEQENYERAKSILWQHSSERALGKEVKFTADELQTINNAWEYLGSTIQDLTLAAYPEVAVALLLSRAGSP